MFLVKNSSRHKIHPRKRDAEIGRRRQVREIDVRRQIRDAETVSQTRNRPARGDFQPSLEKSYRTRTCWLGRQDSNLGMAESKSARGSFDMRSYHVENWTAALRQLANDRLQVPRDAYG
jgi:hypothetical protein